eukprot:Tbor_TRINITY_DN988_c0_g1::TRINITY_DN988_c0_g1_i1::g.21216::m.21216
MNPTLLLQRQMEAAGAFRNPINNSEDLLEAKRVTTILVNFISKLSRLSTKMEFPLEMTFQCLMQLGIGVDKANNYDTQAGDGNVPMHQAKVLDRNCQLKAQKVEPQLRQAVSSEEELLELVERCSLLRQFLRMKVEDGNDLSMANKLVALTQEYFDVIYTLSHQNKDIMYKLFLAESEEEIRDIVGNIDEMAVTQSSFGGSLSQTLSSTVSNLKPIPNNPKELIKSIMQEAALLTTLKGPVAERQRSLSTLLMWCRTVDQVLFEIVCEDLFTALAVPLQVHMNEKRSGLLKIAAEIVSFLVIRAPPQLLADGPQQASSAKEAIVGWLEGLCKGVHVTVRTISQTTSETIRDIVILTYGASFVVRKLLSVLKTASQPDLRKKLISFLTVAAVSARSNYFFCNEMPAIMAILPKMFSSSDGPTRKNARIFCAVVLWREKLEGISLSSVANMKFAGGSKQTQEFFQESTLVETILAHSEKIDADVIERLELEIFKYEPSKGCLYWDKQRLEEAYTRPSLSDITPAVSSIVVKDKNDTNEAYLHPRERHNKMSTGRQHKEGDTVDLCNSPPVYSTEACNNPLSQKRGSRQNESSHVHNNDITHHQKKCRSWSSSSLGHVGSISTSRRESLDVKEVYDNTIDESNCDQQRSLSPECYAVPTTDTEQQFCNHNGIIYGIGTASRRQRSSTNENYIERVTWAAGLENQMISHISDDFSELCQSKAEEPCFSSTDACNHRNDNIQRNTSHTGQRGRFPYVSHHGLTRTSQLMNDMLPSIYSLPRASSGRVCFSGSKGNPATGIPLSLGRCSSTTLRSKESSAQRGSLSTAELVAGLKQRSNSRR